MKNWMVEKKFRVALCIIFAIMVCVIGVSILSMGIINRQNKLLQTHILSNSNYIWEIRRDIISAQRYMLMALESNDDEDIRRLLENVKRDNQNMSAIFEQYIKNNEDHSEEDIALARKKILEMETLNNQLIELFMKNNEIDNEKGAVLFEEAYKPLHDEIAQVLIEISRLQQEEAENQAVISSMIFWGSFIGLILIAFLALGAIRLLIKKFMPCIVEPLKEIEVAADALLKGDFSVNVTYESEDEFGHVCRSLNQSLSYQRAAVSEILSLMESLSEGDFTVSPSMSFPGELRKIEIAIQRLVHKLNDSLHEITLSASQISAGSQQLAGGAQALASGALEQASGVQELYAAVTEVADKVHVNARNAKSASQYATVSGDLTRTALEDMKEMSNAMREISNTADNIGDAIRVIHDIAFRTNILALNATVEAARAGDAGQGFAVVADEVRELAQKSSEAAKEITVLVESSTEAANYGESITRKTRQAFEDVAIKVEEVLSAVDDISIASEEQSTNITQIIIGVEQISNVVQMNSTTSQESATVSEQFSGQANMLRALVSQFALNEDRIGLQEEV